jgi:hypothetical protein
MLTSCNCCRFGSSSLFYSVFPSVILSEAKELVAPRPFSSFEDSGLRAATGGRLRGAMRPLAVLQSSALWLSRILIGNLL